jgi:hypothetical protein
VKEFRRYQKSSVADFRCCVDSFKKFPSEDTTRSLDWADRIVADLLATPNEDSVGNFSLNSEVYQYHLLLYSRQANHSSLVKLDLRVHLAPSR